MSPLRLTLSALGVVVVLAGLFWAFRPQPVPVDIVEVQAAPMQVTVAAEGVTRVRDPHQVTAPVAGMALRSPVRAGDSVLRDATVLAIIQPAEPGFLDARARALAE